MQINFTRNRKCKNVKKYFNLYNEYCIKAPENIEKEESNYVYYSYVMEDEQKDDLTLLAIRRQ